jgi:hypothetical protein
MLPAMIDGWALWLLLVGLAIGAAGTGVMLVRLPRADDDIGQAERRSEAGWIADTIQGHGGVAPVSLVEEVLDLHGAYLASPRVVVPAGASVPPVPPLPVGSARSAPPASYVPVPPPGYVPPPSYGSPPGPGGPPATPPPAPPAAPTR